MDLTSNTGGFIGTFILRDGESKGIVVAKSKMTIAATGRVEEIWIGYVLPVSKEMDMLPQCGIWDKKGNFIHTSMNGWDLMKKVIQKA